MFAYKTFRIVFPHVTKYSCLHNLCTLPVTNLGYLIEFVVNLSAQSESAFWFQVL